MAKNKGPDKLAQEVSQAIAAGMSYGKWKAMQEQKPPAAVQRKPVKQQTCAQCGKVFDQYDRRARKYCSMECVLIVRSKRELERQRGAAQ